MIKYVCRFPILIRKLCFQVNIPPKNFVRKPVESSKITATSKIMDVKNALLWTKSGAVVTLEVVPDTPVVIL